MSGSLISITQIAEATPFDNSASPLTSTNVQHAIEEVSVLATNAFSAKSIIINKLANETISALNIVYLDTSTTCVKADNTTYTSAIPVGIALSSGILGDTIEILELGIVNDASFLFGLNVPIYLGLNGAITATPPSSGYLVKIGYGLGSGAIFIKIEKPIAL